MKTRSILISAFVIAVNMAFGQRPAMELIFTAIDSAEWIQLDSIKVMNRTQGGDTLLIYPDTALIIDYVGVPEIQDASDALLVKCYPNPVTEQATISIFIPGEDIVRIRITNLQGRMELDYSQKLSEGEHTFTLTPGAGSMYLLAVDWKEYNRAIKIINFPKPNGKTCYLTYSGHNVAERQLKKMEAVKSYNYTPGDTLLFIGYADTLQSGILEVPETNETYFFQFATNIPCPGTPTVEFEGQVYNTIQIFSQCWLKENLNVGAMIPGDQDMTDNGIIEKYCYNNESDSCTKYGGLYQWQEVMQYVTHPGAQGICPPGWHLPSEEEWKVLEGAVDSQYGIGDKTWDDYGFRGFDAGTNLKTAFGWYGSGNGNDLFGFSGKPGGGCYANGNFDLIGGYGYWWTSKEFDGFFAYLNFLRYNFPGGYRDYSFKDFGFSVRCVLDK